MSSYLAFTMKLYEDNYDGTGKGLRKLGKASNSAMMGRMGEPGEDGI